MAAGVVSSAAARPAVDLRHPDWPVRDQGTTGACVGFAAADGVLHWHYWKAGLLPPGERPSPRFIWMANKETDRLTSYPTTFIESAGTQTKPALRIALARLLEAHDCAGLKELFHAFFASIPYQRYAARRCRRTNNDIADYEGFYASVFYSYFAALGYEIAVEESSSHGRLDLAVRTGGHVYLFEFKVVEMTPPGAALAQLQERRYADKYRARGEPIHLVGVEFSRDTRNLTAFEVADG